MSEPIQPPQSIYLVGPTASGKSTLALALAEVLGGEIVNVDAFQLYQGLNICTAKPSVFERQQVPHHLYDVLAPTELSDAAFYAELARPVIADIMARSRVPIIVGGSGLYVKALTHGLSDLPSDEALRQRLSHLTPAERVSWLLSRDPEAETLVNLKNDRYVSRALEICLLTGQPQSSLRRAWQEQQPEFLGLCLVWQKEALDARINERVLKMLEAGLIEEIAALGELSATAEKAIGVRQIRRHFAGELSLSEATAEIQAVTRQYAKRQRNWFRRETGFQRLLMSEDLSLEDQIQHARVMLKL
jgi:tRNA dimethylallyltransferase